MWRRTRLSNCWALRDGAVIALVSCRAENSNAVAIARALANKPRILLADEPTGNLDPETSDRVFNQLMDIIHTTGVAALIATHNMDLAQRMDRVLTLDGGKIVEVTEAYHALK